MNGMSTLCLDAASKLYGDTLALDTVSINFPTGQITAVIGPSGCGKSTLLKLCNGLVRPDQGSVQLFGVPLDYDNLPRLRRRIGYAVQGTALFPHLTTGDNITLLARLADWSADDIDQRLHELLALTHLDKSLLQRFPHQLSGGQQQRVGLCRAMMLRPEVLLLDEPFAAIDPMTRIDIHRQMLELHAAEPVTTALVTHDMREAMRLADHLVILKAGNVVFAGSKAQLLAKQIDPDPEEVLYALLDGTAT